MKKILLPLTILLIGFCWLLSAMGVLGRVDWAWTGLLAVSGVVVTLADKLNQFNLTLGLFLVYCAIMAALRQSGVITLEVEVPLIVIGFGGIWLAVVTLFKNKENN